MNETVDFAVALTQDDPGFAASMLSDLPPAQIVSLLEALSADTPPEIIAALPTPIAVSCLELVTPEQAAAWLQEIGYPLRTILVRNLTSSFRRDVLSALPKSSAKQITRDIAYVPDSVGAWMEEAPTTLLDEDTVGNTLTRLRRQRHTLEQSLVVLGKARQYRGIVTLSTLLKAPDKQSIKSLTDRSVLALDPDTPLSETVDREEWAHHFLLPVTGKRSSFLGILHRDRLHTALTQDVSGGATIGSDLLGHLMEAALISAAGMSHLMPKSLADDDSDFEREG